VDHIALFLHNLRLCVVGLQQGVDSKQILFLYFDVSLFFDLLFYYLPVAQVDGSLVEFVLDQHSLRILPDQLQHYVRNAPFGCPVEGNETFLVALSDHIRIFVLSHLYYFDQIIGVALAISSQMQDVFIKHVKTGDVALGFDQEQHDLHVAGRCSMVAEVLSVEVAHLVQIESSGFLPTQNLEVTIGGGQLCKTRTSLLRVDVYHSFIAADRIKCFNESVEVQIIQVF